MEKLKLQDLENVEIITPSGYSFTIRQQTGDDDDIISNAADSKTGMGVNNFIAAITIAQDFKPGSNYITGKDVKKLKLCDKHFLLIASRIFSLGNTLNFMYEWHGHPAIEYTENLDNYVWDYGRDDFPNDPNDPAYFKYRIKPHPMGKATQHEFTTTRGNKIKFNFHNGDSEAYLIKLPEEVLSKNQELIARGIQVFYEGAWALVENFSMFTAREMVEIRKEVERVDPGLELVTDIVNPFDPEEKIQYPLVASVDFFYPREI